MFRICISFQVTRCYLLGLMWFRGLEYQVLFDITACYRVTSDWFRYRFLCYSSSWEIVFAVDTSVVPWETDIVEQERFGLTISIVPEERLTFFNVLTVAGVYTTADITRTLLSVASAPSTVTVNASITLSAFDDMCPAELQILPEGLRPVWQYFMFQLRPDAIVMFTAAVENNLLSWYDTIWYDKML